MALTTGGRVELAAVAVAAFVLASSDSSCAWSHRVFSTLPNLFVTPALILALIEVSWPDSGFLSYLVFEDLTTYVLR